MKKARIRRRSGMVIFLTVLIFLCPAAGFSGDKRTSPTAPSSVTTAKPTRTITYYGDQRITVPLKINRIASGWPAQNSVIAMLGYGDKIVATVEMIKTSPTFRKFVPSIANAVVCLTTSGELNIESITQVKPDVVFGTISGTTGRQFQRLEGMGMSVAYLKSNSLQNLVERAIITGQILGDDAYERARKYVKYYNENVRRVTAIVSKIPQARRVRVYHCLGNPLMTQSAPSLVQDWMDMAGVINVARDWNLVRRGSGPSSSNINLEQILGANPDMIVCMNPRDVAAIKADPSWQAVKAVKEGKVYINPKGMFWWCRETTEEALQFLWLAKTAYPSAFQHIDMVRETRRFYKEFYGYTLSEDDIRLFLNPI